MHGIDIMNFATFDLNLMRVLDALLREGSTVRAGERLGLSQPAVSAALGRLRHALDDELFVRQGSGLVPTDYARGLALPLRQEIDRIEALFIPPTAFDPSTAEGTFRLAGSDFFAEVLMPVLARELPARAPKVRVQLIDLLPSNYLDSLERYQADIALIPAETFPDWVEAATLFQSPFGVIARPDHPAILAAGIAPGGTLPLDLFCSLGHALFSPEGRMQSITDEALAKIGKSREVVMTMPVFSGICRVVAESDLIAVVPRQLGLILGPKMGLVSYEPPIPMPTMRIVAAWHRRSTGNPTHRWLRTLLQQSMRPLDDSRPPSLASG
ncbi:LysR family transcriptional regulator [Tabrizicola sp. J26]|uniref:LysR family transcriptional regulator n=1 Tax=Alitabrizicola rongguiensis TaxID=2909234 RepID=UPI001F2EBED9|nr:LysR family transcriptional regulator [Tabrizicola rongguiensis]MCF1708782.1 LysR family transcriptional regulator [Tabrizicola rongguiensis]